jgi:hypothetical protein
MTLSRALEILNKRTRASENDMEIDEASELIQKMAGLKNQLKQAGVIRSEKKITSDYAEWFCTKKFNLSLSESQGEVGYDAVSEKGEKIQIKSRTGKINDYRLTFDGIRMGLFDLLFCVFIDEDSWMITDVFKVTPETVQKYLSRDRARRFKWRRESRQACVKIF